MDGTRFHSRALPDPDGERIIRRIMRLTFCTLLGVLFALMSVTVLV